ncbi:FAD-binding oxidoreductase [Streptomyces luteireticuli]|uniref:FAD-binding oxidoreductase n=1 Tax=Streptomyces luteireticuli TaxID=173858 RepID=UPI0035581CCC
MRLAPTPFRPVCPPPGPTKVTRDDPRYASLTSLGTPRFRGTGTPEYVWVVRTTDHVVRAVQEAVRKGKRLAVRSGGHCYEDFVDDPSVQVVIDLSCMTTVSYDRRHRAFAVEAGATLGQLYRELFLRWGVTVPAGWCPGIGVGGHVVGGGYGPLCRWAGLSADHLHAVEVVFVDRNGTARRVVATREPGDRHRELWWAHTGGGGGNFGVATRYWFRAPDATGHDPRRLLPAPPASVLNFHAEWDWRGMDEAAFSRLVGNQGRWSEEHSSPGSPFARLDSELHLFRALAGRSVLDGRISVGDASAQRMLDDYVTALNEGVGSPFTVRQERLPWLTATLRGPGLDENPYRLKPKSGYLRGRLTDRQTAAAYHHLTRPDSPVVGGALGLYTCGGEVNAVAPDATASAQRDSVLKAVHLAAWTDPAEDAAHLAWVRAFYRDFYADTGGVPVPGAGNCDGSYINYPDVDLADPEWNSSGTPWSTLYYKDNYARLQTVKARWDPRNVFTHVLGVEPA